MEATITTWKTTVTEADFQAASQFPVSAELFQYHSRIFDATINKKKAVHRLVYISRSQLLFLSDLIRITDLTFYLGKRLIGIIGCLLRIFPDDAVNVGLILSQLGMTFLKRFQNRNN